MSDLLLLDHSSVFNKIIPQTLVNKLSLLGLKPSLGSLALDSLTNRPQAIKIHGTLRRGGEDEGDDRGSR